MNYLHHFRGTWCVALNRNFCWSVVKEKPGTIVINILHSNLACNLRCNIRNISIGEIKSCPDDQVVLLGSFIVKILS